MVFCFVYFISLARNLHNLEPLALTLDVHKEARSKGGMSNAHKTQNESDNTHTSHNTSSQHTQRVLYSNRALVAITKNRMREIEVLVLRNAYRMLGVLLHAPRGPFYSPKAARSR
jgi:hypothetical protein